MTALELIDKSYHRYAAHEKVAGRDFFLSVWWYRIVVLVVDLLSIPAVFASAMTMVLYKFFKVLLILAASDKVSASVLVAFCTLGVFILCIFTFAWTYFAARKYTPAIVEALATKISGGKDIEVPKEPTSSKPKVSDAEVP